MLSFKEYILTEGGKFRKSQKLIHKMDLPMFSLFLDKSVPKDYNLGFDYYQDTIRDCFSDARTQIQKMGFPSMHTNVVFKDMDIAAGNRAAGSFVAGLAHGNPTAQKDYKQLKSIGLNYLFVKGLGKNPEKYIPKLTETIVHEWGHIWMFNNGKAFRNAITQYHEALVHSNVDKLPYDYFKEDPNKVFNKFTDILMSMFSTIVQSPNQNIDYKTIINKTLRNYIDKLGNLSIVIDAKTINDISAQISNIFEKGIETQNYDYVKSSISNLDMSRLFGNDIKHTIQSGLVKKPDVREKLSKLIQFTGAYGLSDPDETWAALLQYFSTLHPYHKQRIFQLMQVR